MKKLLLLICLNLLIISAVGQQNNYKRNALLFNVGLGLQNLYNGFNSPIMYSGLELGGSVGYVNTDYDKVYHEVRMSFRSSTLFPIYQNMESHNWNDIYVSSLNAELKYRYAGRVYSSDNCLKLYAGGNAMIDFGLRNNSAMSNGSTDINLSLLSIGISGGMYYQLTKRVNFLWFLDIPIVSAIYCTHYLGGIYIDESVEFKIASLGSYQKITSDLCLEYYLKNGNAFRLTYAFLVMNNSNNQKITIGSHMIYLGFMFNLSKPQ